MSVAASGRRRGRRPAEADTRGEILAAARTEFAERGYDGATMRGIARVAGVDPRLMRHYFDGKEALFVAALGLPVHPAQELGSLADVPASQRAEAIVRTYFRVWDAPGRREALVGLLRSAVTSPLAARMLRQFVTEQVIGRVAALATDDDPELRAGLIASQLVGLALGRYVLGLEPLASADAEDLIPLLVPTVEAYLHPDG